jgi:phenylacetic acid degradation protein
MPVYQIDGLTPVVPEESYVHPTAVLIGDVILGKGVYVGPNASLRGDFGRIVVKDGANIQDNCVMHGFPNKTPWWKRTDISATAPFCMAASSGVTRWWA